MFGSLAATLPGHLRVIRWDQRGCGRSEHRGPYRLARSAADLGAVHSHLGLEKTALLGHSWGATLALRYALDHPDRVSALVYVSGTGLGWAWREPFQRAIAARLAPHRERLDELRAGPRTEASDRELAILQWSADFNDGHAMRHAEQMATPWFGINHDCFEQIWGELRRTWHEAELIDACRSFGVPVLIMDGSADLRPRSAVDSLAAALPNMTRVVLPSAGHVPMARCRAAFDPPLLEFLEQA